MMKKSLTKAGFICTILSAVLLVLASCDDVLTDVHANLTEKIFTGFSIPAVAYNSGVSSEVDAVIDEDDSLVNVTIPWEWGVDITDLIAEFQYTGMSVSISGVQQESGVTVNDFTNALTYTVDGGDDDSRDYRVTVRNEIPAGPRITRFAVSPDSTNWYEGVIDQDTFIVIIQIPGGESLTSLTIQFELFDATDILRDNGFTAQTTEVDVHDFSSSLTFYAFDPGASEQQAYTVIVSATL